jgi:hypothetical protein
MECTYVWTCHEQRPSWSQSYPHYHVCFCPRKFRQNNSVPKQIIGCVSLLVWFLLHISHWRKEEKITQPFCPGILLQLVTSCINDGFTVMSNGYRKMRTKDGIAKYLSQQEYVFSWAFEDATPALLDCQAFLETQILITDQCPVMCPTLTNPMYCLKLYGNSICHICKWHKVSHVICRLTRCQVTLVVTLLHGTIEDLFSVCIHVSGRTIEFNPIKNHLII